MRRRERDNRLVWTALIVLLLVTAATYWRATANGFVLDDYHTVVDNPHIRSLTFVDRWVTGRFSTSGVQSYENYRPVLMANYAVDYALWGPDPRGFHATNVLVHLLVVVLSFHLALRVCAGLPGAWVSAAIVALHPINAEVANYVTARSSSLTALFVLTALLADDAHARRPHPWQSIVAYGSGVLAMATKEGGFVLPALVVVWRHLRAGGDESLRLTLRKSLPWWILTLVFLIARTIVTSGVVSSVVRIGDHQTSINFVEGAGFALKIYLASLYHWLLPIRLAVDPGWPFSMGRGELLMVLFGASAATLATLYVTRRNAFVGCCLWWFWIAILPTGALGFLSRVALYQDNRVYLSGIGLAWGAGYLVDHVWKRFPTKSSRATAAVACLTILSACVVANIERTRVWRDQASLWHDTLQKRPESYLALLASALLAMDENRPDEAKELLEHARKIAPNAAEPHVKLGMVWKKLGNLQRAESELKAALTLKPGRRDAQTLLAEVFDETGRSHDALALYEGMLRTDANMVPALAGSAELLNRLGRVDEAINRYRRLLIFDPGNDHARVALGTIYLAHARWAEAREMFSELRVRLPDSSAPLFYLGLTYAREGRDSEALPLWEQAILRDPDDVGLLIDIGDLHARAGRWTDAVRWFNEAVTRNPDQLTARLGLAAAFERLGERANAMRQYQAIIEHPDDPAAATREQARAALKRLSGQRPRSDPSTKKD